MFLHNDISFVKPFKDYHPRIYIPLDDTHAYKLNEKYRWVYNKLQLYKNLGYKAYPHGVEPKKYPVFSKPICNLWGMSIDARIVNSRDEFTYTAGHLWMPIFNGRHISTDYAIEQGKIKWSYSMMGTKDAQGSFTCWSHIYCKQRHEISWIHENLSEYTGLINIESIGKKIIEVHLRFSDQYVDLYGKDFIPAVINLYEKGAWEKRIENKPGYSQVLRIPRTEENGKKIIDFNVKSTETERVLYIPWENSPLSSNDDNDLYTYRIAIINGHNKRKTKATAKLVADDLKKQLEND